MYFKSCGNMQEFLSNIMQEASLDYSSSFEFIETAKNRGIPKSHCNIKDKLHQREMAAYTDRPYTKWILFCWKGVGDPVLSGFLENVFYKRNGGEGRLKRVRGASEMKMNIHMFSYFFRLHLVIPRTLIIKQGHSISFSKYCTHID